MTLIILGTGMAFMLWWPLLVEHRQGWDTGGDMWGIWRAAHYIGWGFLGGVYDPSTGVNSLPGLEILLAPFAMVSDHLGLTESFPPYFLVHPTAALLLEPIELLLASTVLFAVDALAEQLAVTRRRRIALCVTVACITWPTVALWGHAEDCLAMALAIYSLVAGLQGRWKACGWLFGFALLTQPLVVMVLPILVALSPKGRRLMTLVRSVALSAVLVIVAFASDAADTYRSLVNHATPWVSLAPRVSAASGGTRSRSSLTFSSGRFIQHASLVHARSVVLVSGGAGRLIEVLVAVLLGLYVWRRPQPPDRLIWLVAVCLGMRCLFEAVMTPYYLAPPLVLALAIASRQSGRRFWAACIVAFEISVFAYQRLSPWAWWLPVVLGMGVVLALGFPAARVGDQESPTDVASCRAAKEEPLALTPSADELQPVG
jgi:hypothetical protein